jgi:histidine triad (HIT) family protein
VSHERDACVFCEVVAGREPASVVYRDEVVCGFMDIQPVNPGHLLVIPLVHAPYLSDLDTSEVARMFGVAQRLATALRRSGVRCEGINFFLADGVAAGQEIFHAHLHVFPRFEGDGIGLRHPPEYHSLPARASLERIANAIRIASVDVPVD